MDKSCNSSGDSSAVSASTTRSTGNNNNNNSTNRDHYLRQLNKLSHKISKPTTNSSSSAPAPAVNREIDHHPPPPLPPPPPINQGNLHQHQPPVYNINKNDFRDVVQKLTGSPAHERISAPPQQPIHHPKPHQSSRLHRIRPPPLAQVINRPPGSLNDALIPLHMNQNWTGGGFNLRPTAPLSPLPPLPPVHAAAESPVSSYMRYLQNSMFAIDSNRKDFSGLSPLAPLVSPRWYQQQQQQQQQENAPPSQNSLPLPRPPPPSAASGTVSQTAPTSIPAPPPFGCLNSPKSPYGLLSPSILLSPTSGQLGFPVSPTTVPLPSPKYKGR
ncbi:PREDICTED: VQ motif-containing protein 9-like isoform X2 [Camelina sativa]|uniref:VQ motif-containing protein 9-like isoform X2 n=1 Tax=Camelina sativa TaxID=90675 RepID=A0ABM0SVP7_CAMSA|nr:PREDICTED: VQ motif-containing protein 9-like isoform X2 [Camelina sativa]